MDYLGLKLAAEHFEFLGFMAMWLCLGFALQFLWGIAAPPNDNDLD
jgi:hypothetical protein